MPTKLQDDALNLYAHVMTEIKVRFEWIEYVANGRSGLPGPLAREFGYLQLRMVCELIALGCLTAHGDIEATKASKFQRESSANDILNGLENLHPNFYPTALKTPTRDGMNIHFERLPAGSYMTKAELLKLYGERCGNALHRGNLRHLMTPRPPVQKHFPEIMEPAQRIANLLSIHSMALYEGDTQFMCWLDYDGAGRVHVAVAEG
jgi:hypothetical protein